MFLKVNQLSGAKGIRGSFMPGSICHKSEIRLINNIWEVNPETGLYGIFHHADWVSEETWYRLFNQVTFSWTLKVAMRSWNLLYCRVIECFILLAGHGWKGWVHDSMSGSWWSVEPVSLVWPGPGADSVSVCTKPFSSDWPKSPDPGAVASLGRACESMWGFT